MIKITNISKIFKSKNREVKALNDINLTFEKNGFNLVRGESGSGKTTLLNIISKLINPTSGEIIFTNSNNQNVEINKSNLCNNICVIHQDHNLISDLSILDNIKLSLSLQNKILPDEDIIKQLNELNLLNIENEIPNNLSGGQRQRVSIARALLLDYKIILADEPTASLDEKNSLEILKILKGISKNKIVIVVSHENNCLEFADRIIELENGNIIKDEVVKITEENSLNYNSKSVTINKSFLFKLGTKYTKFKSIKFYLSIMILIITFTFLLTSLSLTNFSTEKAYNEGISELNVNNGKIQKRIQKEHSFSYTTLNKNDIEFITSNFNTTFNLYEAYSRIYNESEPNNFIVPKFMSLLNEDILKTHKFDLTGRLPQKSEIVLSLANFEKLNLDIDKISEYTINIDNESYKISGVIQCNDEKLDDMVVINSGDYNFFNSFDGEPVECYTEVSTYSNINKVINHLNSLDENYTYVFDNTIYNSVERAVTFNKVLLDIGIILSSVFIFLTIIIVMNIIFSMLDEKKTDIFVLKKLGYRYSHNLVIFIIQPIIMTFIAIVLSIVAYIVILGFMNDYVKMEFLFLVNIFNVDILTISLFILTISALLTFSTSLPLFIKQKNNH